MRKEGWADQGYYPTPPRVTDIVANSVDRVMSRNTQQDGIIVPQIRILDPCCGEGTAVATFADIIKQRASPRNKPDTFTYGLEVNRQRARQARSVLRHVWNADIDQARINHNSFHCLWLNPPYDWDQDPDAEASNRLESRFLHQSTPGLCPGGVLIYIIPYHVLRQDAQYLTSNYRNITVRRFPDPEYDGYHQIVVTGYRRQIPRHVLPTDMDLADLIGQADASNLPPPMRYPSSNYLEIQRDDDPDRYYPPPLRILSYSTQRVVSALQEEGLWHRREIRQLLDDQYDPTRIRPLEKLPEGHAAMAAANSMVDNALIPGLLEDDHPIIVRGFFRKTNRETMRTENTVVRTDFFQSNIRAMDAITGEIAEVGSDPKGLKQFMDTYGPAIRRHIDQAYPPAIDPNSPECQAIARRISQLHRPLIGKQVTAAIIGAAHLKRNRHLNLFFTQGSGKTCTAYAVAHGLEASTIAVMTPARVIPNWISEIRSVWPDAIVRVVDNKSPIGQRREPSDAEKNRRPAPFGRASLEEIRRLGTWATPDTPLWVLMKKDSARSTHPAHHGLRWIGNTQREAFRPLAQLARAERRGNVALSDPPTQAAPALLYRDRWGILDSIPENSSAIGTCPQCWFPITSHEKYNPRDRNATCLNPAPTRLFHTDQELLARLRDAEEQHPVVRGKYGGTWLSSQQPGDQHADPPHIPRRNAYLPAYDYDEDDDYEDYDDFAAPSHDTCGSRIAHAARNDRGRAVFSYGDYASKHMKRWFDLFIIDEAQDYKARETAQGETTRRLAQRSRKTVALTGTPFGGKVSELFFLMAALHPGFNELYNYRELSAFRKQYGREETTWKVDDDLTTGAAVGAHSKRRETKGSTREIPGYHPALLEMFWDNTIFMDIHDVDPDHDLPTLTQRAQLIDLDQDPQPLAAGELSQSSAYQKLDKAMTDHLKTYIQHGSKRPLSQYLQETLTYPENCWQGAEPTDPETSDPIIVMPPLDDQRLYPKEQALLHLLNDQRSRSRKCLVYCTHTGRRDTTARLMQILRERGFRVLTLKAGTVDSEDRTTWLQREANNNDVIICHPKLVETGVNLLEYPTIIWFEIDYSMFTTEQASARSYRINQHRPVEIYYLAYRDTMQERALRIIARKADVSRTFQGDLSKNGLSAFNPDPDDIREQLARELMTNGRHTIDTAAINDLLAAKDTGNHHDDDIAYAPQPVIVTPPRPKTTWNNKGARQLAMLLD